MRVLSTVIGVLGLVAAFNPASARAQQAGNAPAGQAAERGGSRAFDLHPELTKEQFKEFAGELGSIMRFRQLGDTAPLGKGEVDISVQYASAPIDSMKGAWHNTYAGGSIDFPRFAARFGVGDRVDIGTWGGLDPDLNWGMVGVDTKIALMRQGPGRPVSLSMRPSDGSLIGPSELWAANASLDVSVSRAFGALSPYVGVATTASLAVERSDDVDLDPVTAEGSLAYAGLAYRWRSFVLSAEVEKGALVSYAFNIGTRF